MKLNIQYRLSLALLFLGAFISIFSIARLCAYAACDQRYKAFIADLDKGGELRLYYIAHCPEDYYISHVLNFRPSGKWYSGWNDVALPIVGGAGLALLGLAGMTDTMRQKRGG